MPWFAAENVRCSELWSRGYVLFVCICSELQKLCDMQFVWAAAEADHNIPHLVINTARQMGINLKNEEEARRMAIIANDNDYVVTCGEAYHVPLLLLSKSLQETSCWQVTPKDLADDLGMSSPTDLIWVAVMAANDYSPCGLPGVGVQKACHLLEKYAIPPITSLHQLLGLLRGHEELCVSKHVELQLIDATVGLCLAPVVGKDADDNFTCQLHRLPVADQQQADKQVASLKNALGAVGKACPEAADIYNGSKVLVWNHLKKAPPM